MREGGVMAWPPLPTGDGPGGPAPQLLAGALDAVAASLGSPSVTAIVMVYERWDDIVGPEVAAHARAVGIKDETLRVEADGPGWASHVRWAEAEILKRLDELVGAGEITSVQVRVARS